MKNHLQQLTRQDKILKTIIISIIITTTTITSEKLQIFSSFTPYTKENVYSKVVNAQKWTKAIYRKVRTSEPQWRQRNIIEFVHPPKKQSWH